MLRYPTIVSVMLSLLDLCKVYCRFVLKFPTLASQLNKKLKKRAPLQVELDDTDCSPADVLTEKLATSTLLSTTTT